MIQKFLERWRKFWLRLGFEQRVLFMSVAVALVPLLGYGLWGAGDGPRAQGPAESAGAAVDTFIPRGFVLVPIEIQNYEALDSILGRFANVDLFQGATPGGPPPRLVARNVRLLRAPQNPAHFAVLIAESEVDKVLRDGSLFTVIVKRPNAPSLGASNQVRSSPLAGRLLNVTFSVD